MEHVLLAKFLTFLSIANLPTDAGILAREELKTYNCTTTLSFVIIRVRAVANNSSLPNYPHPDDYTIRTIDTPGFKPFTM